ncbi:CarboxypepD_reg-like domain-containing protein [Chitinophaga costaii]|uniref:CarboxypepD_reg-like domain-containing protein n=1 Tax=Chitinophaga costaii TaxID=1335309 RepID=A0A1C4FI32_9BACT|nr:TonB-dependent receptor [Chitinophaga costaii]PUZ20291.1 TonB-dependent receptor [Chitinophaga costaii]SCC55512.1 CarboxypepD_reg-like domain-containing protein [Chitinophaga costaii]
MKYILLGWLLSYIFIPFLSLAQATQKVTITGTVTNKNAHEKLARVTVAVKGDKAGAISDEAGHFSITLQHAWPVTLVFTSVGFEREEVVVHNESAIQVQLNTGEMHGTEVVVAASRVPESILQSPVSIEQLDARSIRNSPAPSFYDALANIKGVDVSTQSLTFKSVNTRGFASNGNTRLVQVVDGMDNQAPGLSFPLGNIIGITELDLDRVELLPGASSALYGPNALNGILLMNSKNPFDYQGLSAVVKSGVLSDDGRSTSTTGFYDVNLRYAKAFNNKFAFKVNFGYLQAKDWQAYDSKDQSLQNGYNLKTGHRATNEAYNGVNIYGDESNVNMYSMLMPLAFTNNNPLGANIQQLSASSGGNITPQMIFSSIMPDSAHAFVSRTGYNERDLTDNKTRNLKVSAAFHYHITPKTEAILQGSYGNVTTVYTGADRYSIRNFHMGQYKAEVLGENFYVRAYTTQERSGDSYAIGILGSGINEAWKSSPTWFGQYFNTYAGESLQAFATTFQTALAGGQAPAAAYAAATTAAKQGGDQFRNDARTVADQGRLLPGTSAFNAAADSVKHRPIPGSAAGVGAKFTDKSNLYQGEFMYNFSSLLRFMDLLVGGNYRVYDLNSEGTLFALDDNGKEFRIKEGGGYVQVAKRLLQEHLKITASLRYDKNMNFDGQFSPRVSAVYTLGGTHNIRASYQTGFRIPTSQDQYIDLTTPSAHLLGGLPFFRERYHLTTGPLYTIQSVQAGAPQQYVFQDYKPEKIKAFEIGYRSLISQQLVIDAYAYWNNFENFSGTQALVQPTSPTTRNIFAIPVNYNKNIHSWGWAMGLDYNFPKHFVAGGNISYNELLDQKSLNGFVASYNTPKVKYNLYVGNRNIGGSNIGFNVTYRWQQKLVWQSNFVSAVVNAKGLSEIPAYGTVDAQLTKLLPKPKVTLKIGGVNMLNKAYVQSWGNPTVGAQWYAAIGYNL